MTVLGESFCNLLLLDCEVLGAAADARVNDDAHDLTLNVSSRSRVSAAYCLIVKIEVE